MNNNEPIVLGTIKRGKTGKPIVVLILFLIVGIFVLFLPNISSYFGDNSILELIKNGEIVDFFINHDNYIDKPVINNKTTVKVDEHKLINNKTIIEFSNITLKDFNLTTKNISFNVSSNASLEESNYYLILEKDNKDMEYIKLFNNENSFNFLDELENTLDIKGYVKFIKENEYPSFTLSSDESGLSSLKCSKENLIYEYTFNKNLLTRVKETLNYNSTNLDQYYKEYQKYNNKVILINSNNGVATIEENLDGFIFINDLDLSNYTGTLEKNYYSLNTKSNKINFEMKAKGYDCKWFIILV